MPEPALAAGFEGLKLGELDAGLLIGELASDDVEGLPNEDPPPFIPAPLDPALPIPAPAPPPAPPAPPPAWAKTVEAASEIARNPVNMNPPNNLRLFIGYIPPGRLPKPNTRIEISNGHATPKSMQRRGGQV